MANETEPRVALVTGATSGIGRAIAIRLAKDGFEVVVHGRDARRGAEVVEEIESGGGRARFMAADLGDRSDVARLASAVGDVDVLVNNAGLGWLGPTADLDVDTFDRMFAVNVRAPYFLVAAFAPTMAERGRGSIVNIGSIAGEVGVAGGAAYGATKASLTSMTKAWAAEFSPRGVRINTVASGPVYTSVTPPEAIEAVVKTTLMDRAADPEEIADVVSFLASSQSSYVTGAMLPADGGRIAV